MRALSVERLREVLDYDPASGVFRWRQALARQHPIGSVAGTVNRDGYRVIQIDGGRYRAHHLAWLYVRGCWPTTDLDHRNRVPDDNRIGNLREDPENLNLQNRRGPTRANRSGFLGVSWHPRASRWRACITINRKTLHLGLFDTPEAASEAYLAAKREAHPFWSGV